MCRNIRILRTEQEIAAEAEIREAAIQFVRKITGIRKPSIDLAPAFDEAINEIVFASGALLATVGPKAAPAAK
jgi:hypothetical protein